MQCINCDNHLDKESFEFGNCQTCGHPYSIEEEEEEADEFNDYDIDHDFDCFQCCDNCDNPEYCSHFDCNLTP